MARLQAEDRVRGLQQQLWVWACRQHVADLQLCYLLPSAGSLPLQSNHQHAAPRYVVVAAAVGGLHGGGNLLADGRGSFCTGCPVGASPIPRAAIRRIARSARSWPTGWRARF